MIRYADTKEAIDTESFAEGEVAEAYAHIYGRVVEIVDEGKRVPVPVSVLSTPDREFMFCL